MEADYVVAQVSLLAEATAAGLANAWLETRVDALVPVDTEDPIECFLAIPTLKLARRNFLDFAHRGHLGYLGNERMIVVNVLDCINRLQVQRRLAGRV